MVAAGVFGSYVLSRWVAGVPIVVAAVVVGAAFGNLGLVAAQTTPGIAFASKTILRFGIVLLGLRLSVGEVVALGVRPLVVIIATVATTFFGVQHLGRKLGLGAGLSLLAASGFSICGNSAIASVRGVSDVKEEEVAAAIGLVTLCGTAAIAVMPWLGGLLDLSDVQLGVWYGASVQDTAQVIAVGSSVGPAVLAVATAIKLTRVLFLAPVVAGVSIWHRRGSAGLGKASPAMVPLFVAGFVAALLVRSVGLVPAQALELGGSGATYALSAGMVGLGTSVRISALRQLGPKVVLLGVVSWGIVATVSLGVLVAVGV